MNVTQEYSGTTAFLIAGLIFIVSISGITNHDLWTPDEPREAAISMGMHKSGNMLIPELAGTPFVEKPPLFYIIASALLGLLGDFAGNTAALRLTSACFGLGTLAFTYLLGTMFIERRRALLAAAMLATTFGFVHVTHWLLVDNALMFFIVSSIWALASSYGAPQARTATERPALLLLAGLLAACAFLVKGLVGPIIIAFAWIGLFIPLVKQRGWKTILSGKSVFFHMAASALFLLASGGWALLFFMQGGPDLFREWWWNNHFGRFSGESTHLGHISPWHYYFGVLPVYLLPWLMPFACALFLFFKKIWKRESLPGGALMLALWILGTFAVFSASATKREIYLCVILPACALFGAVFMQGKATAAGGTLLRIWLVLLFAAAIFGTAAPVLSAWSNLIPAVPAGWIHVVAIAATASALAAALDSRREFIHRFLIAAMILYAVLLAIYCPLVDSHKSYGAAFKAAGREVELHPGLKAGAWALDETTTAGFYYYCGMTFPAIRDRAELESILSGRNKALNGAVTLQKKDDPINLPAGENQVIFEGRMGKRRLIRVLAAPDWQKECGMKNTE